MIISKQRIISEYEREYERLSHHHPARREHALQAAAQALGIAEQLIAETLDEAELLDSLEFA
ncbi:hypothetical protein ACO0LO_19605 [Undibacterium sp. TJN25]|uniref:hypothetical protein n=1 Tax=Undibacterium sp. TJN25 TaxID=3413056 RepID=UPI003BF35CFB